MDAAALIGRDVEEELGVAPDRSVIDIEEMVEGLDLVVLSGVIEPSGADGDIHLTGVPDQPPPLRGDGGDPFHRAKVLGLGIEMGDAAGVLLVRKVVEADDGNDAPLAFPGDTGLVPDPAGVRAHDGDDGSGLDLADEGEIAGPIVDLALAVRPLAAGAVEPDLGDLAVVRQDLAELVLEVLVVAGRIPVARLVPVPWRKVNAECQAALPAGLGHLPDNVALPSPPRGILDRMLGEQARPEAESVMVFGRDDEALDPRGLDRLDPLAGIEIGRVEKPRVFRPLAPLAVGERVHAEMNKRLELERLPAELTRGRHDPRSFCPQLGWRIRRQDLDRARNGPMIPGRRDPRFARHRLHAADPSKGKKDRRDEGGRPGRDPDSHGLSSAPGRGHVPEVRVPVSSKTSRRNGDPTIQ